MKLNKRKKASIKGVRLKYGLVGCQRRPREGPVVIETIGMGELLGWSWLFPPFKWAFGAVAATVVEAFEFDAPAVREACLADPALGYELNQRITRVLAKRLQATRIRLISRSGSSAVPR